MAKKPVQTKKEFLALLRQRVPHSVGESAAATERVWDGVCVGIQNILEEKRTTGFRLGSVGTFHVVDVPERTTNRRNPLTNLTSEVTVPAHRKLIFKPTPAFKRMVKE